MKKVTITLEEKVLEFVNRQGKGNRSNYINQLLKENYQK
jgi:metal-responsive CopG/Arc/MetJ family transcriptional regulator